MTIEEKRRELFERFLAEHGLESEWQAQRNCYKDFPAHFAWKAFNAALDAVEIELPRPFPSVFAGADEYADGIAECRKAIESTGLGLKVKS